VVSASPGRRWDLAPTTLAARRPGPHLEGWNINRRDCLTMVPSSEDDVEAPTLSAIARQ